MPPLPANPLKTCAPLTFELVVTWIVPLGPAIVKLGGMDTETLCPPSPETANCATVGVGTGNTAVPVPVTETCPVAWLRLTMPLPADGGTIRPNPKSVDLEIAMARTTLATADCDLELKPVLFSLDTVTMN